MAPAVATRSETGLVLGRYRPLRPLGSGGSGSVWHARDELTDADVTLKIVARDGKTALRAEREAAAAGRLRHPTCVRPKALDHDADHVYIAYEYVPGRTLRDALRAGEVDDAEAVETGAQVLEGLAHAHARRIVHRDVKPSNVLLADGNGISARILDFGLAQMDAVDTLTAAGDVPGTLAYIAPERLAGDPAGPASDVWSVGVLLWEALAGTHPFWRPSLLESARAIEAGAPPLRTVRPDLPKALTTAVDRALSLDPAKRPRADRLAHALRSAGTVRARPRPRSTDFAGRVRSRLVPAALAGAFTVLGASALPFYPAGWVWALAAVAAATTLVRERLGVAIALAAPVLPLGNVALGLALVYAAVAMLWFVLFAREPRGALVPAAGVVLGPLGALALLPAAVLPLRSPLRRALACLGAVALACVGAGLRSTTLPLTGEAPPETLGLAGVDSARAAGAALWDEAAGHPSLAIAALALAVAAAALPYARARGPWAIAAWGGLTLAAVLLPAPAVAAPAVGIAVWATCLALWAKPLVGLVGNRQASR
jgi:hypothetical protein